MPRPKRAKVASTARVAKQSKPTQPAPHQQAAKARTKKSLSPLNSFSSDSDGLVVRSTRPQIRMPWQPEREEDVDLTMAGGLPIESGEEVVVPIIKDRTPLSKRKTRASKASTNQSSTRKSPSVVIPARSRSERGGAGDTPAPAEGSSGFGDHLLSFTSLDSESPAHGTRPPSAIKVGATPAHESSLLALKNFKRRPRQPSLLRMVNQTTDVEDNDLDFSDLDDFHPDAESTPLPTQKNNGAIEPGNDSGVNLSSSGSRGTKRKLSPVVQVPASSPPYDSGPDIEQSRSPSPSLPEVVQSTEEAREDGEHGELEIYSETMAPPMSSSDYQIDETEDPPGSPVNARQRRRGASTRADKNADSEGEETERPRRAKGRQKARSNHGISTTKLQALLPRRRTQLLQEEDEYGVPSSVEVTVDTSEDELALPARRATSRRKPALARPSKKGLRAATKGVGSKKAAPKNIRTYGRRTSSDKENGDAHDEEEGEDEDEEPAVAATKASENLEAIAKRFEEVDAFEMDFESVSYVQTSSSPWR